MKRATVVAICLLATPSLFAITRTWTGATSANWSDSTNWSPAGVPDSSDSLIFGAGISNVMKNDLPPGTRLGPISAADFSGFSLTGNSLILTGPVTGTFITEWNVDLKMEADVTLPGSAFHGTLDLNGHTVTLLCRRTREFNSPVDPIDGAIIGQGTLVIEGAPSKITKPSSFNGTVQVQTSCELDASMPDANFVVNGELKGSGTIGTLSVTGDINPGIGDFPRFDTFRTKSLSIDGGYVVDVSFYTPIADRLEVTGTVSLRGALYPKTGVPAIPWPLGRTAVIIDNDGTDPVIGTFQDLPEGALISADGFTLRISYHGGDGNDVTLTDVSYGKSWSSHCSEQWSDATCWTPAVAPVAGEALDFGAYSTDGNFPVNDLPPGFVVGGLTLNDYELDGNPIRVGGDITSGALGGAVLMPVTLDSDAHIRVDYLGRLDMNGHSATFEWLTHIAELNGTGSIAPASLQVIRGTFSGTLSGSLTLGSLPNANVAGITHLSSSLFDANVANVVIEAGGSIDPGPLEGQVYGSTGIGTITAASLSLAGAYNCDFDANTADQVIVNGPVLLSGPLNVVIRKPGQTLPSFTIIDNRGSMPVSGQFSGLPEGAKVQVGSSTFTITYRGGDGNDVVLLAGVNLTLTQSSIKTAFGEPFSVSATVTGATSAVVFTDGVMPLGSAVPENGVATIRIADLGVGSHVIGARFSGATATISHNVGHGATITSINVNAVPAKGFDLITNVQATGEARGVPTGVVSIDIDGSRLGVAQLTGGAGTISTGILAPGKHTIIAHYGGDSNFDSSDFVTELVVAPPRARSVRH